MDLFKNSQMTDYRAIKGGFVIAPVPGCYRGVIIIDANSLYPSLMRYFQIFIARCVSASAEIGLATKMGMNISMEALRMAVGDIV